MWVHFASMMMFLKDVIASRYLDGNIPLLIDVIASEKSNKHSAEETVTDPIISINEDQVQEKRDIINSMIHHRPIKGGSL